MTGQAPLFQTDWLAAAVVFGFIAIPVVGVWLIVHFIPPVPTLKRRPSTPQRGAASGTGVSAPPASEQLAIDAVLPRSPQAPAAGTAPRPGPAAGPFLPVGVLWQHPDTPTGAPRTRVVWHG